MSSSKNDDIKVFRPSGAIGYRVTETGDLVAVDPETQEKFSQFMRSEIEKMRLKDRVRGLVP